ncbi:hypothetical protein VKT23_016903 [Stygiomarasmius scandens]|uniref:Uncharacterized protein n=1 Tax=Marasmiellus scandens TaxID=2682957 RepID=A0ABR1ITQ0_9AGAR
MKRSSSIVHADAGPSKKVKSAVMKRLMFYYLHSPTERFMLELDDPIALESLKSTPLASIVRLAIRGLGVYPTFPSHSIDPKNVMVKFWDSPPPNADSEDAQKAWDTAFMPTQ